MITSYCNSPINTFLFKFINTESLYNNTDEVILTIVGAIYWRLGSNIESNSEVHEKVYWLSFYIDK